jgi:hypothetical protein
MNTYTMSAVALLVVLAILAAACNTSGLSSKPRGTFSKLACLDVNGDGRINDADAADPADLPDFDANGERNEDDAAFVRGVDILLNPIAKQTCERNEGGPEYLVTHDYFASANVRCRAGDKAMLVVGVGGGVDDLKNKDQAAGLRDIVDEVVKAYEDRDYQTIAVIAGPAITDAVNATSGMEAWLTNATQVYLDRFPCANAVLIGFSWGGVSVDVVSARLEQQYAGRFAAVVRLDRIEQAYTGDLTSFPTTVPVLNVYQTNEAGLSGRAYDAPNVTNWDASGELARGGDGKMAPVQHTTIDNAKGVRDGIVARVMELSGQ